MVVVLLALFVGLWLDSLIGQRGLCTLGLIVSSVPLSLWLMVRIALRVVQNVPVVLPKPEPLEPLEEEE